MKTLGIIPARYASNRLPGKPLANICGKPMIWWVYQQATKVKELSDLIVATDDIRIFDVCKFYKMSVIMTRDDHLTAAHRIQEVSNHIKSDFYLQLNGDEPLIESVIISNAIPNEIPQDVEFGTNIVTKMYEPSEVMDPSNIKIVFGENWNALYMSRIPIPYPFKSIQFNYYKHIGIIGYNKMMLDFYTNSVPGRLESIEGIDTLRFIDYGKRLFLIEANISELLSVDTPKDLEKVRMIMQKKINDKEINNE